MADERALMHGIHAELHVRHGDELIAELAAQQHGVVSRGQLFALGLGRGAIAERTRNGRLHTIHRGVYAVGHRLLTPEGYWMAAVLAGGEGAVLSHRSAAALWRIRQTARAAVEVTVPRQKRSRTRLQFHWAHLPPDEITVVNGLPVTTVPRTIFDMAAVLRPTDVRRAINEAERQRLTDQLSLSDLVDRYPRHRGNTTIRTILAELDEDAGVTNEELEHLFREFLRKHGLPRPKFNHEVHAGEHVFTGDCVWPEQRLIVELDGRATHGTAAAFESDRARDRALAVAGWRVIRITWRQLRDEPNALAADLGALLACG